jgi:RNA polymerase sigma factor (sigma-70 family)
MDAHDHDLLTRFRANRDEAAFRLLVERHIGMVYSVARRVTDNSALAEEVAQATFTKLADKSAGITRETALAGWLYQTSRRLALSAVRSDARRRQREQIAAAMNLNEPSPSVLAEYLEPAMDQLAPDDRDALLLRFFEDRTLRDVGQELGLSEDAARMRVNRTIEKMRDVFAKLGITGTAAWLGTTLTTSATASVPAGLGATITTAVLGGTAIAAATTALVTETTATTMNLFNLKTAAAILGAAAVTGTTTYLVQEREADQLRADYQTLNETHGKLAAEQQEARELIQLRDEQIALLKRNVEDLPRLRGDIDRLNRDLENAKQLALQVDQLKEQLEDLQRQLRESEAARLLAAATVGYARPSSPTGVSNELVTRTFEISVPLLQEFFNAKRISVSPPEAIDALTRQAYSIVVGDRHPLEGEPVSVQLMSDGHMIVRAEPERVDMLHSVIEGLQIEKQ